MYESGTEREKEEIIRSLSGNPEAKELLKSVIEGDSRDPLKSAASRSLAAIPNLSRKELEELTKQEYSSDFYLALGRFPESTEFLLAAFERERRQDVIPALHGRSEAAAPLLKVLMELDQKEDRDPGESNLVEAIVRYFRSLENVGSVLTELL